MSVDFLKLKALAEAAKHNQYDNVALNDYGMAMPPAVTLELIAEIERHRQVSAEGCKPEISILPCSAPCAGAAVGQGLDKAEGCKPDLINSPFFYALVGPDGKPHYDDFCVANSPADLECREDGITIVPLYTRPAPESVAALREDIARGERIQLAMALDLSAIAQALGIPPEEQEGGAADSIAAIQDLRTQLAAHADLLSHWLQLANVCDDRNTDLMQETRAMLDGTSPAWTNAASDLLAERRRQIELKGYNSEHDDQYGYGELTAYAVVHALIATGTSRDWDNLGSICTWEVKDDEPRRMLIKAAALLLAALESLDRQPACEVQP